MEEEIRGDKHNARGDRKEKDKREEEEEGEENSDRRTETRGAGKRENVRKW